MRELLDSDSIPEENLYLPDATTSPLNIGVQWRLWKRVAQDGQAGISELQALRSDALSLGIPTLPSYQAALLAARRSNLYEIPAGQTEEFLETVLQLADHLPYAHFEIAAHRFSEEPLAMHRSLPPYFSGLVTAFNWLDIRLNWLLKFSLLFLIALGVSFLGFLFAQLLRYFGIAAYDGTRVLPRGFSSTQTVILLMALVLVPGLLLQSPLLALILLLFLVIPFQQLNERLFSALLLGLLVLLPSLDQEIGRLLVYPGSTAQTLLHTDYHGCETPDCLQNLESLAAEDRDIASFVLASHLFRTSRNEELFRVEELINARPQNSALQGEWLTLSGAYLIATGNSEDALPVLDEAARAIPSSAAPYFNQMRALQILGENEESYVVLEEAIRRDLRLVTRQLQLTRRDRSSFLLLARVSNEAIWKTHKREISESPSVFTPVWTALAGTKLPLSSAPLLGILGLILLLLSLPFYLGRKVSTPCPKCCLARDPREAEKTNHHAYCLPCYQTFVSASHLEYTARVQSETALGRRDRFQQFLRRLISLLLPGSGHILGGYTIRGTLGLLSFSLGLAIILLPLTLWRIPVELFVEDWVGQVWLGWALVSIGATIGLSGLLRGIEPTRRPRPSRRKERL